MINVVELSWSEEKKIEDELYDKFVGLMFDDDLDLNDVYLEMGFRYECAMGRKMRKRFRRDGFEVKKKRSGLRDSGDCKYIYKRNDYYVVCKYDTVVRKNRYFGTYKSLDVARLVRDELVLCGWDKSCLSEIVERVVGCE